MTQYLLWAAKWGDTASMAGLVVSVIGFFITILSVVRSASASERAEKAALAARSLLLHTAAIADFGSVVVIVEEIKRLQRIGAWQVLPDRYATLRAKLIGIRKSHPNIDASHVASLKRAEDSFLRIEKQVDKALSNGTSPPSPHKFNAVASAELDALHEVLTTLKLAQEVENV